MRAIVLIAILTLSACKTSDTFNPRSEYPPDPWVKGYSNPDDCLGGEKLAAIDFRLPDYPRSAFNSGRQGWAIVKLDINTVGDTENVELERVVPDKYFGDPSRRAVEDWRFEPPTDGRLENCRVLIRYRFGTVSLGG